MLIDAFLAADAADKFSLGHLPCEASSITDPSLRSRLHLHRFVTEVRSTDFSSEVDEASRFVLLPTPGVGASFYVVLSTAVSVVAAAHTLLQTTLRHRGCSGRALTELPASFSVVFDRVTVSTMDGVPVVVHASLAPTARMLLTAFIVKLEDWPAFNCHIAANADVDDDANSDCGSEGSAHVRLCDFAAVCASDRLKRQCLLAPLARLALPLGGSPAGSRLS